MKIEENKVSIKLGFEELLYLGSVLDIELLDTIQTNPESFEQDPQYLHALVAGRNSLLARELITITQTEKGVKLELTDILVAAVHICQSASQLMMVEQQSSNGDTLYASAHFEPDINVMHLVRDIGVHEFIISNDTDVIANELAHILHLEQQPLPKGSKISLSNALLEEITQALETRSVNEVANMLPSIDQTSAMYFIEALNDTVSNSILVFAHVDSSTTHNEFVLIESKQGFWQMQTGENELLLIDPVSALSITETIHMMMPSYTA